MNRGSNIHHITSADHPEKIVVDEIDCHPLPNQCSPNLGKREERLVKNARDHETTIDHHASVDTISEKSFALEEDGSIADTIITCGQPVCRICLENGNEPLVSPCKCDGSAKFIHETCLLTWFQKTRQKKCEICLSKVNIISTGCKPITKWRIPKGTYNFVFYFYVIYALATFCTSGIAFTVAATSQCATPTCIALYIACILSIISLIYCAGFTIYIKLFWKAAITTNKNWKVYNRVSFTATEKEPSILVTEKKVDSDSSLKNCTCLSLTDHMHEEVCLLSSNCRGNNNLSQKEVANISSPVEELCNDEYKCDREC